MGSRRRVFVSRRRLDVGDHVRVRYGVIAPRYGWGCVRPEHIGTIERVAGKACRVRFPTGLWKCTIGELEHAANPADAVASVVFGMTEKLFEEKQFADVTFVLADGQEHAHRAILAASSDAFAAMFSQPMQESVSGRVELPDTKAAAIRAFLRLLYTGKIDANDWVSDSPESMPPNRLKDEPQEEEEHADEEEDDPSIMTAHDQSESDEAANSDEEDSADDESSEYLSGDDSDARTGSSCNENTRWNDQPQRSTSEMPLPLLLEVAELAHRYMVRGILALLVEALRIRLFRYFVELEVCPVTCEQPFWAALQEIVVFARRNDILVLRVAALHMARRSAVVRKAYRQGKLCADVRQEFSANWSLQPQARRGGAAHSSWLT